MCRLSDAQIFVASLAFGSRGFFGSFGLSLSALSMGPPDFLPRSPRHFDRAQRVEKSIQTRHSHALQAAANLTSSFDILNSVFWILTSHSPTPPRPISPTCPTGPTCPICPIPLHITSNSRFPLVSPRLYVGGFPLSPPAKPTPCHPERSAAKSRGLFKQSAVCRASRSLPDRTVNFNNK